MLRDSHKNIPTDIIVFYAAILSGPKVCSQLTVNYCNY